MILQRCPKRAVTTGAVILVVIVIWGMRLLSTTETSPQVLDILAYKRVVTLWAMLSQHRAASGHPLSSIEELTPFDLTGDVLLDDAGQKRYRIFWRQDNCFLIVDRSTEDQFGMVWAVDDQGHIQKLFLRDTIDTDVTSKTGPTTGVR